MPRDLKFAFITAYEQGEPLQVWLDRYPEYTHDLIDLAMLLDADARTPLPEPDPHSPAAIALRDAMNDQLVPATGDARCVEVTP